VLPTSPAGENTEGKHLLEFIAIAVALGGVLIAHLLYNGDRAFISRIAATRYGHGFKCLWKYAWGFDHLYHALFVKPFMALVAINKRDLADYVVEGFIPTTLRLARLTLSAAQNGQVRWYAMTMATGVVVLLALVLL